MKYLIPLLLVACGETATQTRTVVQPKLTESSNCSVAQTDEGAIISCPDGTSATVNNGAAGLPGKDGVDGAAGTDGAQGPEGPAGPKGKSGTIAESEPIYKGYFCSKVAIAFGSKHYIINGNLIELTDSWYQVSSSCKVKYIDGQILENK